MLAGVLLGFAYAGSPATIADGVRIAGVDVGGLTMRQARQKLERRWHSLADAPAVFLAGGRRWRIRPAAIGLRVDWAAAVAAARRDGDGFGPVRGFRRLGVRFFGADVSPPAQVYAPALNVRLGTIARATGRPHREAAIVLRGLRVSVVPARTGHILDRRTAAEVVVRSLSGFERTTVALPYRDDAPTVTAADLRPTLVRARIALSRSVRLALGPTYLRVPRWRMAQLLVLPARGRRTLQIAGKGADRFFVRLEHFVNRPPANATFAVYSDGVRVVPSTEGRVLDVPATAHALLVAALSPAHRVAKLRVATRQAERTTADGQAMGITGLVGAYTTYYGGDPNRIHNVQLVAHLIDEHLIGPGQEFSFNQTTGERTAEKGFLVAPVIINGELKTGLGGGICQVSTTTFNAAYEAGLNITARTNHSLYISHYPQGRDATVNYPDTDLQFVNDTGHWLLLRTWVGSDSLTVALYGTPQHRKVESETAPLAVTGPPPVNSTPDPDLYVGETVVESSGSSSLATSVHRKVYDAEGKLLYDNTWYSSYRAEPKEVLVGTKPKPKPVPPPTTTTTPTTTDTTTTEPSAPPSTTESSTTTEPTTSTEPTTTTPPATTTGPSGGF